jgi:two-component system, OmpR family, sensor histidine kinase SenX3
MAVAVAVAGILVGIVLGWMLRRLTLERTAGGDSRARTVTEPVDGVSDVVNSAVDQLELGVVVATAEGRIVYRNTAAAAFAGTLVGLIVDNAVDELLAEARAGQRAVRVVDLQGPPKAWLTISANPTADGGAVVTIHDVSERMRTDAMRTDFVTNVSHELKTPVGAVAVLAEALIDERDPEVISRLADHLVEESLRAVRTVDDLLELSQVESTRPGDSVVDLGAVVREAIGRGMAVDGGRGVQIRMCEAAEPISLRGDERQLVSAVGNLVENAVKYSASGDVVEVRTEIGAGSIDVVVVDQGVGIPSRDLDRVFERFYRVDKARSRDTGGTGLGLSIVRHVATNHGGAVLVQSQEGEGSTFVLRLPKYRLAVEEPSHATVVGSDPIEGGARDE